MHTADPIARVRAFFQAYPDVPSAAQQFHMDAGIDGHTLHSPTPKLATAHARLAWMVLIAEIGRDLEALARIGAPWGFPAAMLWIDDGTRCRGQILWAQDRDHARAWAKPPQNTRGGAPFDLNARIRRLLPGPSGATRWIVEGGPRDLRGLRGMPITAATAQEAVLAAGALRGQSGEARDLLLDHGYLPCAIAHHGPAPAVRDAGPPAWDGLDDLRHAVQAAGQAVRRWDGGDDLSVALDVRLVFPDDRTAPRDRIVPMARPTSVHAAWETTPQGEGFDALWAQEADLFSQVFVRSVTGLPGIHGAPIDVRLSLHAIAGGDVLVGMFVVPHEPGQDLPLPEDGGWGRFQHTWAARLAGLAALPAPTALWRVENNLFAGKGRVVSAACPESAIEAARLLWGHPATRGQGLAVCRMPTLKDLDLS